MARPIRIAYEGAVYHVTLRGNERRAIFKTDGDRERFLQTLSDSVERIESRYHELVESRHGREDISFRRMPFSIDPELILSCVCAAFGVERSRLYQRRRNSFLRPMAANFLWELGGLTQREVGAFLKIGNGASVSKQLTKLSNVLKTDVALQRTVAEIKKGPKD